MFTRQARPDGFLSDRYTARPSNLRCCLVAELQAGTVLALWMRGILERNLDLTESRVRHLKRMLTGEARPWRCTIFTETRPLATAVYILCLARFGTAMASLPPLPWRTSSPSLPWKNITMNSTDQRPIPLVVTNACPETIWPGIGTQNGMGPGTGGFVLESRSSRRMFVSPDWQGRVWGRTNCSFNDEGTGPSNLNGVNGNGAACTTGDCFGRLDCQFTVRPLSCLYVFALTLAFPHRAKSQQRWLSSTSSVEWTASRHSTIYRSSTDTIFP